MDVGMYVCVPRCSLECQNLHRPARLGNHRSGWLAERPRLRKHVPIRLAWRLIGRLGGRVQWSSLSPIYVPFGFTLFDLVSFGLVLFRLVPFGLTWSHLDLLAFWMFSFGFIWFHWVPLGFIWFHIVSLGLMWFHVVSLGFTWVHLVSFGSFNFS